MFRKILVATDGSEHAQRALAVAGNLASRYAADLIVLHVFSCPEMTQTLRHMAEVEHLMPVRRRASARDDDMVWASGLPIDPKEETDDYGVMYQAAERIGQRIADDGAKAAREAGAPKVKTVVRKGDPAEVILNLARNEKADLVVLGSRGLGTLKGLLLGSVSSKVNHLAACSCITVK